MKRQFLLFAFCCAISLIYAQNLVPNGDFEQYDECPLHFSTGYTYAGSHWYAPTAGTSDYFNRCVPAGVECCDVPCSGMGRNETHGGDGMAGFLPCFGGNKKEYIAVPLKQPLVAGTCYYFEMYVKTSSMAKGAIDHLGAYFSGPFSKDSFSQLTLPHTPQISSPRGAYFSQNNVWQKVSGIFTALGGEKYMILGSFDVSPSLKPKESVSGGCSPVYGYLESYVFMDDVLLTDSIPAIAQSHNMEMGCTETKRISVEQNQPGVTYKWNDGSTLPYLDAPSAGKYWVETNWNNCATSVDTFFINPSVSFSLGPDITRCNTDPFTISSPQVPGFNYLWSTGSTSQYAVAETPGIYWIRVQNDTCTLYDEIAIDMVPPIKPDLGSDLLICEGWPTQIDASQPGETGRTYNYKWFRNNLQLPTVSSTLDIIQNGTYRVIRSVATCETSDTIEVQTTPAPLPPTLPDSFICDANSIRVRAESMGFTTLWSTSETTTEIDINTPGTYWVAIGNPPCIVHDTFTITQHTSPAGFLFPDTSFCEGDTISLIATPGYVSYQWSTGQTTDAITMNTQGTYTLKVSDGFCSAMDTITVHEQPAPSKVLLTDSVICENLNEQFVIPLGDLYQYTLGNAFISDSLIITDKGQYELHITDSLGCSRIQQFNVYNYCEPTIYVPNAFSPNADGINDLFTPVASFPDRISAFSMNIYNRWGQLLYTSNTYGKGWDGMYESTIAQADAYVYTIKVTWAGFGKDTQKQLKGNVTLLR